MGCSCRNQTTATATNLAAGTYSVTVSDLYSCDTTLTIDVLEPDVIIANFNRVNVTCFGGNDGSLTIIGTGGSSPYDVTWAGTSSGNPVGYEITTDGGNYVISDLVAGPYQVVLTDQYGCNTTIFPTVFQPDQIIVYTSSDSVSCNGIGWCAIIDSTEEQFLTKTGMRFHCNQTTATAMNLAWYLHCNSLRFILCDTTISVVVEEPDVWWRIPAQDSVSCNGLLMDQRRNCDW